jgi:predicted nucleotidyltransferase
MLARLEQVLEAAPPPAVVAAYLFGSHAEGRAHRDSDVDVGVLLDRSALPTERVRFDEGVRLNAWLVAELRVRLVDLVVLNDAPPPLGARIAAGGALVYCADAELEHAFRRDVQLRAADLAPWLRRLREVKLDAIARRR